MPIGKTTGDGGLGLMPNSDGLGLCAMAMEHRNLEVNHLQIDESIWF